MRLEIGFGGGEHLLARGGSAIRDVGFIGSEAFVNGMAKALAGIEAGGLGNVRLHFGDATELLHMAAARLAGADRSALSRSVAEAAALEAPVRPGCAAVAALARVLRAGGEFRFATDIADYADWTLVRMLRSPDFDWTAERADDWRQPVAGL